ncbi:hypothetical protein BsWGS_20186 [Bradybaena similaris]
MEVGSNTSHRLTAVEALKLMQEVMQELSDPENVEDADVKYENLSCDSESSDYSNHCNSVDIADKLTSHHQSFRAIDFNGTSLHPGPSNAKRPRLPSYQVHNDQWHEINSPSHVETNLLFNFCSKNGTNPGVTPNLNVDSTPLDCFLEIFTDDVASILIDSLNDCTLSHVQRNSRLSKRSEASVWTPLDIHELRKFIAVTTAMSLDRRSLLQNYFSKHPALYTPFYSQMFTREHFRKIFCAVQILGNPNADDKNKIEPFAKVLVERFSAAFTPFENVAIDEMIVGYPGHWHYKQLNTSKPTKDRIKSFGLVDCSTGYIVNLFTYFGANTGYDADADTDELGGDAEEIFATLLSPLGTGYHIFADKWYTTRSLINSLSEKGYYYTGKVEVTREGFPAALINMELEQTESRYWLLQDESLLCVTWIGKKDQELTTIVSSRAVEDVIKAGKSKPLIVDKYNMRMHCCDRGDKTENYNLFDKRSRQWWKKIFHWLLETATMNAHRLYVLTRPMKTKPQDLTLEAFKLQLIEQLTLIATGASPCTQPSDVGRPRIFNPVERLHNAKHIISYDKSDLRCKVCSTPKNVKRTHFVCEGCEGMPHLHPRSCFKIWHTQLHFKK